MKQKTVLLGVSVIIGAFAASASAQPPAPAAKAAPPAAAPAGAAAATAAVAPLAPEAAAELLSKAKTALGQKKYAVAKKDLETYIEANPADANAQLMLGQAWVGLKSPRKALKPFYKAIELDASKVEALRAIGDIYDGLKNKVEAAPIWMQFAKRAKDRAAALKAARLFGEINKLQESVNGYELANKLGALELADLQILATTYLKLGNGEKAEQVLTKILALDPKNEEATRYLGRALVEKGEIDKALPLLEASLAKTPDDPEVNFAFGKAMVVKNEPDKAIPALEKALAKDPKHVEANALLGVIVYRKGDRVQAEKLLTAAGPSLAMPDALAALADLRLEAGKLDEADKLLEKAMRLNPKHVESKLILARVRYAQKRFDDAEKLISSYLMANANDARALLVGGAVAHARDGWNDAITRYEAAKAKAALPAEDGTKLADAYIRTNKFNEALKVATAAISAGAQSARAYSLLAYAQFKVGDKAASRKNMEIAVGKGADDPYVHLIKGESLVDEGKRKEAQTELVKVIKQDPGNEIANALLGDLALSSGQVKEAIKFYRKSLSANAKNTKTRAALVRALVEDERPAEAQKELASLDQTALSKSELVTLQGRIQYGLGNYKKANELYENALKEDPNNYEALYHQGENYLKMPHYTKAIELLEKARQVNPKDTEAASKLAQLYAEVGDRDKAAKAFADVNALESKQVEERRKQIPPDQIKTVAVGRFANTAKNPEFDWIGVAVAESMTADMAKIAYLKLVERDQIEQVKQQLADQVANEDFAGGADAKGAELGKLVAAQWVLLGSYQVAGDGLRLNARLVDVKTSKVERSASQSGGLSDLTKLQKRLALELSGQLVEISEDERRSMGREFATNMESYKLSAEAKMAQYAGDVRAAQARFREAMQADSGNVEALMGLQKAQKDLGTRNTVAIMDFTATGTAEPWIGAGIPEALSSKLSQVSGIQVVERGQIDKVKEQLAFNVENEDFMADDAKIPADVVKMLAAGVVVVGSYQQGGGKVQLRARAVDVTNGKNLVGEQVTGNESELLQLQDDLAKKLVYALIGAPSEEELKALESKQSLAEYKAQMEELARLRAKAKAEAKPEEVAKAEEPTKTEPEPTSEGVAAEVTATAAEAVEKQHVGVDLRLAGGASGFTPGFALRSTDADLWGLNIGPVLAFSGNNLGGGRPVTSRGSTGSAKSYTIEAGLALYVPIVGSGDLGVGAGADVTAGYEQYIDEYGAAVTTDSDNRSYTESDFVLNVRPYGRVSYKLTDGLQVGVGLGYNLQFLNSKTDASGNGLFLDTGIKLRVDDSPKTKSSFVLGYRGTLHAPSDVATATQYVGSGSRGLFIHGLVIGSDTDDTIDGVLYAAYASTDPRAGGDVFRYVEGAYDATIRMFESHRPIINPMARAKVGVAYMSGTAPNGTKIEVGDGLGLTLGAGLGAEFPVLSFFTLSIAAGYDWVLNQHKTANVYLSGYSASLGASFVL